MEWGQLCHCEGSTKKKLEWETKMEHEKIKNKNYEKARHKKQRNKCDLGRG